eukprot:GFYU01014190.1.p1 GENE.GFYU01014190.1~~GFYU01014190.1.p1  ORF type:complete len:707 (+),score=186.31 GFYU01014190.1:158-2278(+)
MVDADLSDVFSRAFDACVQQHLPGSLVFLDDQFAEVAHWNLGLGYFLENGAENVVSLTAEDSDYDSSDWSENGSVVFLIGDNLFDSWTRLYEVVSSLSPQEVTVVCTLSHVGHSAHPLANKYNDVYRWIEEAFTASFPSLPQELVHVKHLATPYSTIAKDVFLLPGASDAFPLTHENAAQIAEENPEEEIEDLDSIEWRMLPPELKAPLQHAADGLSSLLTGLGLKEEVFVLGQTSRFVGRQVINTNRTRAASYGTQASLVLIDRTMDLVAPCMHSDNIMDRIYALLPRIDSMAADVVVDNATLHPRHDMMKQPGDVFVSGSLCTHHDTTASELLDSMVGKKFKESLITIRKQLIDVMTAENIPVDMKYTMGNVSSSKLKAFLQKIEAEDQDAINRHLNLLNYSYAGASILQLSEKSMWDELLQIEKVLQMCCDDPSQSLVQQLTDLLRLSLLGGGSSTQQHSLYDVVVLAILTYSLAGREFSMQEEIQFKEAMLSTLLNVPQKKDIEWIGRLSKDLHKYMRRTSNMSNTTADDGTAADADDGGPGNDADDSLVMEDQAELSTSEFKHMLTEAVEVVVTRLRGLATYRNDLKDFRSLTLGQGIYQSLMKQVVNGIFDSSRELSDLDRLATSHLSLLKGTFSRLGFNTTPKPRDNPVLIIFVVGGITCAEIRDIREICQNRRIRVLIGSTGITTAADIYYRLLCPKL